MRRTSTAAVVVGVLVVGGLSGCGGDPKPRFSHSADPSPSVVSSSAAPADDLAPPEMPEAAKRHTVAGAKAFARYVVETTNYATLMLDPAPLRQISSQHCDGCQSAIEIIANDRKKNATVTGGDWTVTSIRVVPLQAGKFRPMQVTIFGHTTREVITYPSGRQATYEAADVRDRLLMSDGSGGWSLMSWEVL
ncbi:DUF6318 family protein [Nocardioides sp. DS6]|uniref:DUF6318 family protein n=1 Tax=Nocardioides eburneus TaxID=3231482 RepID=A0ABV3SXS9_9ACTN